MALSIKENSKAKALIEALRVAFELQEESGRPKKALIFTESKRTQKYLLSKLEKAGFENILLFNGEISDPNTKEIYDAWRAMNPDKATNKQSIDMKHAIVEEFRDYADILIATDAASEGLNLQFCDTVINYDLPWNPMKIEQRIGRCHRYGQDRDVAVFNLINTENSADKRVYEILENKFNLFKGVFGASDDALGLLESGSSFEKKIQKIYDTCRTEAEFKAAFDKLERDLTSKQNKKSGELKDILVSISSNKKKQQLKKEAEKIKSYFEQLLVWNKVTENTSPTNSKIIMIENNDVQVVANKNITDGYIFIGSFNKNGTHEFLQPVLAVFDNNGTLVTSDSYYVLQAFKNVPRQKFIDYMPSEEELDIIATIHENIPSVVAKDYLDSNSLTIINNKQRLNKWAKNRIDKYDYDTEKLRAEIEELRKERVNQNIS